MGYNQEVSVSRILVSYTLMASGGHQLQIVGVTVSLWLIIQFSKADSFPQVTVHVLSKLHLFGNVAYC